MIQLLAIDSTASRNRSEFNGSISHTAVSNLSQVRMPTVSTLAIRYTHRVHTRERSQVGSNDPAIWVEYRAEISAPRRFTVLCASYFEGGRVEVYRLLPHTKRCMLPDIECRRESPHSCLCRFPVRGRAAGGALLCPQTGADGLRHPPHHCTLARFFCTSPHPVICSIALPRIGFPHLFDDRAPPREPRHPARRSIFFSTNAHPLAHLRSNTHALRTASIRRIPHATSPPCPSQACPTC